MHQPGEPSVEEILNSIKKVIARDTRSAGNAILDALEVDPADRDEADEVLDLAEAEMISETDTGFDTDCDTENVGLSNEDALILAHDMDDEDEEFGPWHDAEDGLLADADAHGEDTEDDRVHEHEALTSAAVRNSLHDNFAALAMMSGPSAAPKMMRSGETSLEGLTRELLRPMLAEWLDANLPNMVEKLVKAEISRITGKRG